MAENTKIEWADDTANFWEGCTQISPACDNCYAKARAERFGSVEWNGPPRRVMAGFEVVKASRRQAMTSGQKRFVFVNSLSDFFDNQAPSHWRYAAMDAIAAAPECTFLLLTKRIGNVAGMVGEHWSHWPENAWLGITVVNQEEADRDIPKLLEVKSQLRIPRAFLSCEPLLGPIDLANVAERRSYASHVLKGYRHDMGVPMSDLPSSIDWVIAGGESGKNARPMHPDWARQLQFQCAASGVPFMFKQWGEWAPGSMFPEAIPSGEYCDFGQPTDYPEEHAVWRVGKARAGRLLDGVEHNGRPEA